MFWKPKRNQYSFVQCLVYSALMTIEQWGIFNVPHLLWHEPTLNIEDPLHSNLQNIVKHKDKANLILSHWMKIDSHIEMVLFYIQNVHFTEILKSNSVACKACRWYVSRPFKMDSVSHRPKRSCVESWSVVRENEWILTLVIGVRENKITLITLITRSI